MNSSYKFYEEKYNKTKPIRGRSVDVRPIGQRRRDWETITTKDVDGGKSYIAKLYNTECVEYFPNGDIVIRSGDWATPTTAEFIHEHSPFRCFKRYKKLWIQNRDDLLPINGELRLKYLGEDMGWEPAEEIVIQQRVVDKQLAKAARAPLMPFVNFCEAFLKMSDGWVMHDTRMEVGVEVSPWGTYDHNKLSNMHADAMYDHIATCDDSEYLYLLSYYLGDSHHVEERRLAKVDMVEIMAGTPNAWQRRVEFYDCKYSQTLLRSRIFEVAKRAKEIHKIVEVKPSGKAVTNTL
jgi:hypothetical protein